MTRLLSIHRRIYLCAVALLLVPGGPAWGVDEDAAKALLKASKCTKCHSVDKKKDGPSYKETAARLKGKAGAADELYKHLTTNPKVKVDGKEEEHSGVKSSNEADIRNLVAYILAQ